MPYTPYPGPGYEPYPGAANGNYPPDQGQNGSQQPGRPLRGRTYGGPVYPGYPDQRWQGGRGDQGRGDQGRGDQGRGDQGRPASPASYADRGQHGMHGRRTPLTPHDRRGLLGGRGQQGRRGTQGHPVGAPGEARYSGMGRGMNAAGPAPNARTLEVTGIFWSGGGQGLTPAEILDNRTLQPIARVSTDEVRRLGLRSGDLLQARAIEQRSGRPIVSGIDSVNGRPPEEARERPLFEQLTATFPDRRIRLEQGQRAPLSTRIMDLFSPLGFGSRALIVAPPKTGKTTLIREAAEAVLLGYPDAVVMAVLVGERPEEVTDLRSRLEPRGGWVYAASFDEETERHAWLVQVAVERAKRVAESGRDAFMVLDSLTRLARAENLATRGQGRTLSGGIDAQALDTGRRAFGAARNLEEGGSLTILATCLVDTGSRQDDVVYEEFKGTGNMELHLSRELSQRRVFPAVDVIKSGTRREEMLLTPEELRAATALRRYLADKPAAQATEYLLKNMERMPTNAQLIQSIEASR
jgi:transcription termination factor Rho